MHSIRLDCIQRIKHCEDGESPLNLRSQDGILDGESGRKNLSIAEVTTQLLALGVRPGGVLIVHTSFRAVRPLLRGPLGLIQALLSALGPAGTLVMPSWTGNDDEPFDSVTTRASPDLGII